MMLLVGAGLLAGCRKSNQGGPSGEAVKQSLDGLRKQLDELKTRFMTLRERVESIPHDLPGFGEARAKFYAVEEGRGTTDAKWAWLSSRLDAAKSSGNREELQDISIEIAKSQQDIGKIDQLHTKMLHEMMAFERMARQQKEAAAASSSARPLVKSKRSKSTP